MSDVEISDKTIKEEPKGVDRLLAFPLTFGDIIVMDEPDVPLEVRDSTYNLIKSDPAFDENSIPMKSSDLIGRRFHIFVLKSGSVIMTVSYTEWLSCPFDYGISDFCIMRYIFPEYRDSNEIIFIDNALKFILFRKGIAKRVYGFYKVEDGFDENDIWDSPETVEGKNSLCFHPQFKTMGLAVKALIKVKAVDMGKFKAAIFELSADDVLEWGKLLISIAKVEYVTELDRA